jgi:hypothetical protein
MRSASFFGCGIARIQIFDISIPARQGQSNETNSVAMRRGRELTLLDPGAAPLNQDDKHNDKQHARDNLDDRGTVHEISLSELLSSVCFLPGEKTACNRRQSDWCALPGSRAPTLDEKGRNYNKQNLRVDLNRR